MCSYIVEKAALVGTAKGPNSRWMKVDTANVYYDHPYEAQLDHALCVDFVCEANGGRAKHFERALEPEFRHGLLGGKRSPDQDSGVDVVAFAMAGRAFDD